MKNDLPNPNQNSVDELWASKPTDAKLKKWIDDAQTWMLPEFINSIPADTKFPQHKRFRDYAELVLKTKSTTTH
jgi:hypothetical protein